VNGGATKNPLAEAMAKTWLPRAFARTSVYHRALNVSRPTMNTATEISNKPSNAILHRVSALALGLCISLSALADTTTLGVSDATISSRNVSVTLNFPVARSGDTGYEAVLSYHTVDGSAFASIDYTAVASSIIIPAGSMSASIPVTIAARLGGGLDQTFQLIADAATGIGPALNFAAQQAFATGSGSYSVTVSDVNGDGKPDLIVTNVLVNTVSVLLNTTAPVAATPSFAAQQTFATGSSPSSVTVADVNGDGKPDLIVADGDGVLVLLNTTAPGAATPSFATHLPFATGNGPSSVTVADVNGDGKPDLIVANLNDSTLSVLLNNTVPGAATPSFATQQTFATGSMPISVTAADVNGDGKPDLIVANSYGNTVSVLLNTAAPGAATPSFATQQTFATGQYPYSVTAADVNGDGKSDLIVANAQVDTVSVLLNTTTPGAATPSFATQKTFATGSDPHSVKVADVNGDGKPDLIVANDGGYPTGNTVWALLNTTAPGAATPSFAAQQSFATGSGPSSVTVADVNGDGKPDLIETNWFDKTVSVLLNTTAPPSAILNFAGQQIFTTGSHPYYVTTVDLNGDGKPDLIAANCCFNNAVSVQLNTTPPGAATPSFAAQQSFGAGANFISVTAADVNGDGIPDLIVTDAASTGSVLVLLNTTARGASTLSFAAQESFATGAFPYSVTTADVNGDGKPDLVVANDGDNTVSVLLNTTTAGATTPTFATQQTFATGTSPYAVTVADVNGDGKPDLIVANFASNTASVLLNSTAPGAAVLSFAAQQTFAAGANPTFVKAVDINGDGKLDLIVSNYGSGGTGNTISVLLNTTSPGAVTMSFAAQQTFGVGSGPISVTASDLDGDGKPDLIVANAQASNVSVLLNTTTPGATSASFNTQQPFATGSLPYSVVATDLNGDGKPDLIVANDGGQTISVLLNTQYQALFTGSPATGTITHDYIFANGFE
jgi:trimeric autotransporter adhesin